jgi:hypothetical protein
MYVSCVNELVSDINIQNTSTRDHDYCTENFMDNIKHLMTDRSATENKVNEIIYLYQIDLKQNVTNFQL